MSDMQDLDEQERARRKKEQIAWRTKKNTSTMFMWGTSLLEIALTIITMVLLTVIGSLIVFNIFDLEGNAIQIILPIMFIGIFVVSVVFAFVFYRKLGTWIIKKFNLEDKLLDEVLEHYKVDKTKKEEIEEVLKE